MKRMRVSSIVVFAAISLLHSQPPNPLIGWYSLGLEKTVINCVLCDDTAMVLAGIDRGAMVKFGKLWYKAEGLNLPVMAMARLSKDGVAAAAGTGSNSDGIYIGEKIKGEPYYRFTLLFLMERPQALTVSGDTIYAGSDRILYRCVLPASTDPAAFKPEPIKLPPYAFGVENPLCKVLKVFSGRLVAGGYDRSPNPGRGHLLYNVKDSMHIERVMNVSAMTSIVTGIAGPSLAVGTIDSGVYVGRIVGPTLPPVQPWTRFDAPNKEPVNDMIAVPTMVPTMIEQQALAVAVKSGVYMGGMNNIKWTEIGSIPSVPFCLTLHGNGWSEHNALSFLAGTDNGVYRYGPRPSTGTPAAEQYAPISKLSLVAARGGESRLVFTSAIADRARVAVHCISGRLLYKTAAALSAGANSIALPLETPGRGVYIVSVRGETTAPLSCTVTLGR